MLMSLTAAILPPDEPPDEAPDETPEAPALSARDDAPSPHAPSDAPSPHAPSDAQSPHAPSLDSTLARVVGPPADVSLAASPPLAQVAEWVESFSALQYEVARERLATAKAVATLQRFRGTYVSHACRFRQVHLLARCVHGWREQVCGRLHIRYIRYTRHIRTARAGVTT